MASPPCTADYTERLFGLGCSSDADCAGLGGVCEVNNNGVSYCVNEVIREVVKEITIEKLVYADQSCSATACPSGYSCSDAVAGGRVSGLCSRVDTVTNTVTVNNKIVQYIDRLLTKDVYADQSCSANPCEKGFTCSDVAVSGRSVGVCSKTDVVRAVDEIFTSVDQSCASFDYCAEGYKCVDKTVNTKTIAYCEDVRGGLLERFWTWITGWFK
jgi:hypothetical protein